MAPKRKTRASNLDAGRQPKRGKVDPADYSAWGWVGTEVLDANQIARQHVLTTCGFVNIYQQSFHLSHSAGQEKTDDNGAIIVEDDACDRKTCRKNPFCTNFLGQEKWEHYDGARKAFMKHYDLSGNPQHSLRDSGTPVGLENLGATCYANAYLQVWFRNPSFRRGVYECQPLSNSAQTFMESPVFHLQVTFAALQHSKRRTFNPVKLVESLKLRASEQQDAQEFSKLFLSHLESEFKKQESPVLQNLIASQFEGKHAYVTVCHGCKRRSARESSFLELEINLEPDAKLEDRLLSLLSPEILNGDNQYSCSECNSLKDATRSMELSELPPVLHISLLRFVFDPVTFERKKSKHKVSFPEKIDMGGFLGPQDPNVEPSRKQVYQLRGVLLHKGPSAYHGHYEAEIFDEEAAKWFSFNDEIVTEIKNPFGSKKSADDSNTSRRMQSKDAYMLVYSLVPELDSGSEQSKWTLSSEPPSTALEEVAHLNATIENDIEKYREQEQHALTQFENTRMMVMQAYRSWTPTTNDNEHLVVVSRQALECFLSRPLSKQESCTEGDSAFHTLSIDDIICTHGKLNPRKGSDMKCIRDISIQDLGCCFSPLPLSVDDVCDICVREEFSERLYCMQHPLQVSKFDAACEEEVVDVENSGSWLSKAWLKDWRLQRPKLHIAGQGDLPPDHEDFTRDVKCEHGSLSCDRTRRIHISAEATRMLQALFPSWSPFTSSDSCPICQAASSEANGKLKADRGQASIEKVQLKNVLENNPSEVKAALLEDTDYAVLPTSFIHQWRRWAFRPAASERPQESDTSVFLCEHGMLNMDLNATTDWTDAFVLVRLQDRAAFSQHYPMGELISAKLTREGNGVDLKWKTDPPVCHDCRLLRKSSYEETQVTVRVIRKAAGTIDAGAPTTSMVPAHLAQYTRTTRTRGGVQVKRVTINPSTDVKELKMRLQDEIRVSTIAQLLFYNGQELNDNAATMASLGVLADDEFEVYVVKEDVSLLDEDVEMSGADRHRSEGPAFEGTLLGFVSGSSTPSDGMMVEPAGLTCSACTFSNALDADMCSMCGTSLG